MKKLIVVSILAASLVTGFVQAAERSADLGTLSGNTLTSTVAPTFANSAGSSGVEIYKVAFGMNQAKKTVTSIKFSFKKVVNATKLLSIVSKLGFAGNAVSHSDSTVLVMDNNNQTMCNFTLSDNRRSVLITRG